MQIDKGIREELHRLLDKLIDEDKEIAAIDLCQINPDETITRLQYRMHLHTREEITVF